jgi:hypothetical protein
MCTIVLFKWQPNTILLPSFSRSPCQSSKSGLLRVPQRHVLTSLSPIVMTLSSQLQLPPMIVYVACRASSEGRRDLLSRLIRSFLHDVSVSTVLYCTQCIAWQMRDIAPYTAQVGKSHQDKEHKLSTRDTLKPLTRLGLERRLIINSTKGHVPFKPIVPYGKQIIVSL